MTRDEAAEILADNVFPGEVHEAAVMKDARGFINAYVALGMLNLGDPGKAWGLAEMALVKAHGPDLALSTIGVLRSAGLKIVEA